MIVNEKPLVTVCFTCYNRKRYVAEAFQSVLNQTYSPLEIVVSDNCSTDGTFEIVKQLVDTYHLNGGHHKISIHRNEKNIGHTQNMQKCFGYASGELLVCAHDDDVSLPNRVERIVEEWVKGGCKATVIYSALNEIDIDGKFIRRVTPRSVDEPLGAVATYTKRVIKSFDPLPCYVFAEDVAWAWRSRILGHDLVVSDALVNYRVGSGASTVFYYKQRRKGDFLNSLRRSSVCLLIRRDLDKVKKFNYPGTSCVAAMVEKAYSHFTHAWRIYPYVPFRYRVAGLKRMKRKGCFKNGFEFYFNGVTFLQPWYLGAVQRRLFGVFKRVFKRFTNNG